MSHHKREAIRDLTALERETTKQENNAPLQRNKYLRREITKLEAVFSTNHREALAFFGLPQREPSLNFDPNAYDPEESLEQTLIKP